MTVGKKTAHFAMAMTSWHAVDSDDEFENDAEAGFSGKTAILVVIDVSPTMFKGWEENEETPYLAAMKVLLYYGEII